LEEIRTVKRRRAFTLFINIYRAHAVTSRSQNRHVEELLSLGLQGENSGFHISLKVIVYPVVGEFLIFLRFEEICEGGLVRGRFFVV